MPEILTSLHGRKLGLTKDGSLAGNGLQITAPAVDAVITVGAEATDARAITVQLNDANGAAVAAVQEVELLVLLNSSGTDYAATGGSTGIAIGASGKLLTVVAKKYFRALSTSTGAIALTWTDTGTEAAYLGVKLPSGRMVISAALTNA